MASKSSRNESSRKGHRIDATDRLLLLQRADLARPSYLYLAPRIHLQKLFIETRSTKARPPNMHPDLNMCIQSFSLYALAVQKDASSAQHKVVEKSQNGVFNLSQYPGGFASDPPTQLMAVMPVV
jgi:hypothetical protein